MKRLFFRTYVGLCLTYLVALFAGARLMSTPISLDASVYERVYGGGVSLAADRLAVASRDDRPAVLEDLRSRFAFPIDVFPWDSGEIESGARTDLAHGARMTVWSATAPTKGTFPGNGTFLAATVSSHEQIVRLGPLPASLPPTYARWALVLVGIGLVLGLGVWGLLRPIANQFRALEGAADRLRAGDLDARADETGASTRPLARAFNGMADDLHRLVTAQRDLLHAVSHELRTPLSRIRFAIEHLAVTESADARSLQLGEIDGDLDELDDLVGELLTFSRLDHSAHALQVQELSMRSLLDELEREFPESEIMPLEKDVEVRGDPRLLQRALGNVVANARLHASAHVQVRTSAASGHVRILVDDDGPGIAPADRERVFEPFVRLTTAGPGVGLGLAIVRHIVERHGGSVWIESAPLGGCRVILELPAA